VLLQYHQLNQVNSRSHSTVIVVAP